jgi:acyl-coenzyme A thioesterase PaaI-like protein
VSDPSPSSRPRWVFPVPRPAGLDDLGVQLRRLIDTALRVAPDQGGLEGELRALATEVEALERRLRPFRRSGDVGTAPGSDARPFYAGGPHNPTAPLPTARCSEGVTRGQVRFGVAAEGPPGAVHGGQVALLFDQIMGQHNAAVGTGGLTGRLEVRYRRPAPLDVELSFEVRTRRATRRWAAVSAELCDARGVVASAEGMFVRPSAGRENPR